MLKSIKPSHRAQVDIPERRPSDMNPTEVHPGEVRPAEVRPAEVRPTEVCVGEVGHGEECPAEVRPTEVCAGEVRPDVKICYPPLIPGCNPLLQPCKMFFICHRSCLHRWPPYRGLLDWTLAILSRQEGEISLTID